MFSSNYYISVMLGIRLTLGRNGLVDRVLDSTIPYAPALSICPARRTHNSGQWSLHIFFAELTWLPPNPGITFGTTEEEKE
jgi:hypothetical protein